DEAQAASRAKSAFLANTSHEIRTPLNGLLGLGRLAQQPDISDAQRREYVNQMMDSAEGLSGLISDILDLSKIEAGRLTLE
ncbi:hybrid sensor histidine kinase/response regulator, partial [Escherichia coli]